ncbi:probable caffeoyl-CoA O-methyltransferase 1 isoform X1 [Oscarella lobularis]|uniref:probable caffeoyl-CoA O-methyltransferase 1 isoform X1 n=3 Tax=Oscarella lobularis TaxID=121494 RepID=UPI0033143D42
MIPKLHDQKTKYDQAAISDYVLRHTKEHPASKKLREVTMQHKHSMMLVSADESRFFGQLVRILGAKKCIEIGTYTGYNTLSVALALPDDGKVIACDVVEAFPNIGKPFWKEAGVEHKIDLRIQPAEKTLDDLIANGETGTFDFVFIDADKPGYDAYYEKSLQLLRPGGVIALDNVLWNGAVTDASQNDPDTVSLREIGDKVYRDERVDTSFLPIADGVQIAVKL